MNEDELKILDRIKNAYASMRKGDLNVKEELEETLIVSQKLNFDKGVLHSYGVLGLMYSYQSEVEKAIEYQKKSLEIKLKIKDLTTLASSYDCLAGLYIKIGNRKKAMDFYMKGLKICDDLKQYTKKAELFFSMGTDFHNQKDYEKAEKYYLESWDILKNVECKDEDWQVLDKLGILYLDKNEEIKAKQYFDLALKKAIEYNNPIALIFVYKSLAEVDKRNKNYKQSLLNLEKSLAIVDETGFETSRMNLVLMKADILILLKEYDLAKQILLNNIKNIKHDLILKETHKNLFSIYNKQTDFESALKHHLLYIELKEKIEGIDTQKHIRTTEAKYQNEIKEKEKEILRLQKVEMEQKALRAQLNPHFFFNSLNSINKFIVDNDAENASKFLFKFSSLMRKTLENSEESFITIEEEVEYLNDYLSLEQLRFNHSFQFKIDVDEEIEDDFVKIPTMMLQPYIENSIKHGVNGIENGLIKIEFKLLENDSILCLIEDNGRGRRESKSKHKSMGTNILENRIEILKDQYQLEFSVRILDLKDNKNKASGTRVELVIPSIDLA